MVVDAIKNGIVIDHIKSGGGMEIYHTLKLEELDCQIAIIKNAPSTKLGKKDIIKIADIIEFDWDVLGYIDADITVNIIKNGELSKKCHPKLPETIEGVIECKNPRCITSTEPELAHIFKLTDRQTGTYRCVYCESKAKHH